MRRFAVIRIAALLAGLCLASTAVGGTKPLPRDVERAVLRWWRDQGNSGRPKTEVEPIKGGGRPLLRVLIGVVLFSAAYMAEVVRGGLQAIPRGQYEGAMALGLGYWRRMGFVIVPQSLKLVIPNIVGNFIGLFKDTTLVLIVAIFDLLGQMRAAFADPALGLRAAVAAARRILVLGAGKAGAAMAAGVEEALADCRDRIEGLVNVPAEEKAYTGIAAVHFLNATSRYDRADQIVRDLLAEPALAKSSCTRMFRFVSRS